MPMLLIALKTRPSDFGQDMHKNELFLLKTCKNRPALGAFPQIASLRPANPHSRGLGL